MGGWAISNCTVVNDEQLNGGDTEMESLNVDDKGCRHRFGSLLFMHLTLYHTEISSKQTTVVMVLTVHYDGEEMSVMVGLMN